jgi:hypothetical protein
MSFWLPAFKPQGTFSRRAVGSADTNYPAAAGSGSSCQLFGGHRKNTIGTYSGQFACLANVFLAFTISPKAH